MKQNRQSVAAWNIHPGEILREDFLKPLDMSSYYLAKRLGVPVPRIHDIVLEKRGITADTAVRLARFFGTSPEFWMNLQSAMTWMLRASRARRKSPESERGRMLRRGILFLGHR